MLATTYSHINNEVFGSYHWGFFQEKSLAYIFIITNIIKVKK